MTIKTSVFNNLRGFGGLRKYLKDHISEKHLGCNSWVEQFLTSLLDDLLLLASKLRLCMEAPGDDTGSPCCSRNYCPALSEKVTTV
jgi:hypothetical protein